MTPEQELLSDVAKTVFRLNGMLLALGERLAQPAGLTAARWQVLGAVLKEPLPVAVIAKEIGTTRQSVQRVADILVQRDLARYRPNPAHRRAKLLDPTDRGRAAIRRIAPGHADVAGAVAAVLGMEEFRRTSDALSRLSEVLEPITRGTEYHPGTVRPDAGSSAMVPAAGRARTPDPSGPGGDLP